MKKIIPLDSFKIVTSDTLDVVLQRLRQCVIYQGSISEKGFKISRNQYRGVLTLIQGRFETQSQQTKVYIKITLHPMIAVSLGFLCFLWYGIAVPSAFESAKYIYAKKPSVPVFSNDENFVQRAIESATTEGTMPIHMVVFYLGTPMVLLVIFLLSFWSDVKKNRRDLAKIIQGEIIS